MCREVVSGLESRGAMIWGALFGEENPRSAFFDHSWALFRTYLARLSRFTVDFDEITDSGHFWLVLALCYQGDVCDMSPYLCVPHGCCALCRLVWP